MSYKWLQYGEEKLRSLLSEAILDTGSMRSAAAKLQMNFQTFRKYTKRFGLWKSNQSGKGLVRKTPTNATPLEEILKGMHPNCSRGALKRRLFKAGLKKNECETCGLSEWLGKPITIHIDHKNGSSWDHRLENLRMLCPNCHSQTPTYCGRNLC